MFRIQKCEIVDNDKDQNPDMFTLTPPTASPRAGIVYVHAPRKFCCRRYCANRDRSDGVQGTAKLYFALKHSARCNLDRNRYRVAVAVMTIRIIPTDLARWPAFRLLAASRQAQYAPLSSARRNLAPREYSCGLYCNGSTAECASRIHPQSLARPSITYPAVDESWGNWIRLL